MYSEIEKNAYLCHRNMKEIKNIAFDFGGVVVALSLKGAIKAFEKIGVKDASERLDAFHQKGVFEDLEAQVRKSPYKTVLRLGMAMWTTFLRRISTHYSICVRKGIRYVCFLTPTPL